MAELSLDQITETITETARDAFYVTVGAGVLAFQRLQVQRVELTKSLDEARDNAENALGNFNIDTVTDLVEDRVKLVEERLAAVETSVESLLDQIEDRLPEQARELVKQARELVGLAA